MRRKLITGLLAQGVASLSNIVMSLFVARLLGAVELGRFSLVFATLTLATAIQTAWVGDGLAVLGPRFEAAARWWQHVLTIGSTLLTTGILSWTGRFSPMELLLYGLLCVCWLYEEFGRRWFMAQQRFLAQGVNDLIYLMVSLGAVVAWLMSGNLRLTGVLAGMTIGAAAAALVGQLASPHRSRVWRRPGVSGDLGYFRRYGVWRSAAAASGAASTVLMRNLMAEGLGLGTLGNLELGRSLAGPAMTALAGLGNVLLPVASVNSREQRRTSFHRVTILVTTGIALYGVVMVVGAPFFVALTGGSGFRVSRTVMAGWLLVAVAVAATQSISVRSIVELPSRTVFLLRSVGTVLSLGLVAAASFSGAAEAVPFAIAAGTFLQGGLLFGALSQSGHKALVRTVLPRTSSETP